MGHVFKHIAVRLWMALLLGGLSALVVLPPVAGAMGPEWMIVPGIGLLVLAYWIIGMAFSAMGHHRLNRLIGEAAVWERAGMAREARHALTRAEAALDSFYFSPVSRKAPAARLLAQLARFQLSQTSPESSSDAVIGSYLHHFPRDREAAGKWLEKILAGGEVTQQTHDIAASIGAAHADDRVIQRMLAQFYLSEQRCDFSALQTYRQLLEAAEPLADDLLGDLASLFLAHQRADGLALKVYLAVNERGRSGQPLVAGIAACCRLVHPTASTLPLLQKADAVLNGIDPSRRRELAAAFLPEIAAGETVQPASGRRIAWPDVRSALRRARAAAGRVADGMTTCGSRFAVSMQAVLSSRQTKTTVKWAAIGLLVVAVGWLVVSTTLHLADDFKPVEKTPEPAAAPVTDPFTLQVAAYLKEADARRYVDQLKGGGLDAYWTRASGNSKTWYQVRISHFKTKAEARTVGDDLKARHLIGDYYVANYKRPDLP